MANRYVNLQIILDRILRDSLFIGLTYEAVVDYYIDFLDIVMSPDMFQKKFANLEVKDYRVTLPEDFFLLELITISGRPIRENTDPYANFYKELDLANNKQLVAEPTYKIEGGTLYTSVKEADVELSYYAVPMIDGQIAVPGEGTFLRAFQRYVEAEFLKILYRNNRIDRSILDHAEQQYYFAVGQYETSSRRLDLGKAESFFNAWNQLILSRDYFSTRFKNMGRK